MIRRAFRITPKSTTRSIAKIEELLEWVEGRLANGHGTLLGGNRISFVDFTFAALSGLWVWPENFGDGRAEPAIPKRDQIPTEMTADMDAWRQRYPLSTAFVERLYRDERRCGG